MGLCVYQNTVAEQRFSTDSPAVAFLATLMESPVAGESVDLPAADEFTLHILAAVAQKEATAISTRTRDALAAKKARGFQLGTPAKLTPAFRQKALESLQRNAQKSLANRQAAQLARLLRATGMSLRGIAARLNESGYRTLHLAITRRIKWTKNGSGAAFAPCPPRADV